MHKNNAQSPKQIPLFKEFCDQITTEIKSRLAPPKGKLWTYQEVAARLSVSVDTVADWFKGRPGLWHPTKRTVRIPEHLIAEFERKPWKVVRKKK